MQEDFLLYLFKSKRVMWKGRWSLFCVAVLVLINKMWLQLGILALIYAAMMVVLFATSEVQAWIDVVTDLLRDV